MALNFIPSLWAERLIFALDKASVYGQDLTVNQDYEGEIEESGNMVAVGSDTPNVLIDQSKYFNFYVDSVDRAQLNQNVMDEALRRAAWALREKMDSYIADIMAAAILPSSRVGSTSTPKVPTKDDAYEYLVDLGIILDGAGTPIDGRFVVIPAWFHGLLLKDERFVPRTGQNEANGQVGTAAGFAVLKSNCVPNTYGTKYRIIAGHKEATAFAQSVVDIQTYKPEKRFGDGVKGLHVYGAKVVDETKLAELICNKS